MSSLDRTAQFWRTSARAGCLLGLAAIFANADTLTLRNGTTVQGTFLGGTARQVRMDQNGDIRTYDVAQIQSVIFSDPEPQGPSARSSAGDYRPRDNGNDRDQDRYRQSHPVSPGSPQSAGLTIPIDTTFTIRMIDSVNSDTSRLGETFRASPDEPVFVNGQEVIPRGADVLTKLVTDRQSGKIEGRTVLTLALSTVTVNGRPIDVTSTDVKTESSSHGARSGKVIGGTAALGAIVGALAGGGKGAAIGAGSGAALGTGAEVLTGGQKVKIPSETRLTFRLQNPVQL